MQKEPGVDSLRLKKQSEAQRYQDTAAAPQRSLSEPLLSKAREREMVARGNSAYGRREHIEIHSYVTKKCA